MKIHTLVLGPLATNTYIIEKDNCCILIDCPSDKEEDIKKIEKICQDKEVFGIIYTHNHFDHISGGYKFKYNQYMHKKDIETLEKQIDFAKTFLNTSITLPKVKKLEKIKKKVLNVFGFRIIETPGHTKGSICILFEDEKILFAGDTLFKESFGRYDLEDGNFFELRQSLNLLLELDPYTKVYPSHGKTTKIYDEIANLSEFLKE